VELYAVLGGPLAASVAENEESDLRGAEKSLFTTEDTECTEEASVAGSRIEEIGLIF
jgi:hypothetical protein